LVTALLSGCGGGTGEIDLDTLNPLVTDMALEPGSTYELTFQPDRDGLDISVQDAPDGIVLLDVVEDGQSTVVVWPFEVSG
jgi:hypothetical protein